MKQIQDATIQPYFKVRSQFPVDAHRGGLGLFTSILAPSLARVLEACGRVEASDACAKVAVAMTRYRIDRGMLPARLADLVPAYLEAVPVDPFDGNPIRMAIKDGNCIIYSVGPDGVDDGDVEIVHGKGDVIFTLNSARPEATTKP